ncbi:16S rRNA (adenine(1518)-N(6)/adenine(1519)-N(6))-dimethyltransferase RsmA [Mobiluncus mulieris]|uniref:Ribosomal RNA small subunit methyltransferase A n=1 Tax=Mobiluncus mulieris TaxID=2052 RepID=A0A7Y0UUL5_9ACTO|nr:16S rRNA (adenine(1518)-N(6)/adenine(1519)-N(6))-dimethyltransferase RsmA [Mobiluncus mulieris]
MAPRFSRLAPGGGNGRLAPESSGYAKTQAKLELVTELLGTRDIRELCLALDIKPSKKRGQNFVTDPGTVRRIAAGASLSSAEVVLEIGPGLGSLTLALLETGARVIAVEIDSRLAAALPTTVRVHEGLVENLYVSCADALHLDSTSRVMTDTGWPPPVALVANLPYNVATPILLHILEVMPEINRAQVMVQAEVADRLVARVGDSAYGAPSVKLAWWGCARRAFGVSRQVFMPIPNVDSTVVEFRRESPRLFPGVESLNASEMEALRQRSFEFITAAFGMRRKTLRQSLARLCGSPDTAAGLLEKAGIDPGLRAENLGVADFAYLARVESTEMVGK